MVQKILKNSLQMMYVYPHWALACSQSRSRWCKFFGFPPDGSYGCTIHRIDLQFGLLLRNTVFFTPVLLKDFYIFGGWGWRSNGFQCGNFLSSKKFTNSTQFCFVFFGQDLFWGGLLVEKVLSNLKSFPHNVVPSCRRQFSEFWVGANTFWTHSWSPCLHCVL